MKNEFVRTSNVTAFLAGVSALENRGAGEACMALVSASPGFGKTRCGEFYASQLADAVFIRVKQGATSKWILTDLVEELGEQAPAATTQKLFNQAFASLNRKPRPIVLDEVEHTVDRDLAALESIRDLSDLLEIPVILLGREFVPGKLRKHQQIWTRISAVIEFGPATADDVAKMVDELCAFAADDAVLAKLHAESEGHMRPIMNGVANIERIGHRQRWEGKAEGRRVVTMEMVGDRKLTAEWTNQGKVGR